MKTVYVNHEGVEDSLVSSSMKAGVAIPTSNERANLQDLIDSKLAVFEVLSNKPVVVEDKGIRKPRTIKNKGIKNEKSYIISTVRVKECHLTEDKKNDLPVNTSSAKSNLRSRGLLRS